jgi:hypothetical protein
LFYSGILTRLLGGIHENVVKDSEAFYIGRFLNHVCVCAQNEALVLTATPRHLQHSTGSRKKFISLEICQSVFGKY